MAFKQYSDEQTKFNGMMWDLLEDDQKEQCKVILLGAIVSEKESSVKHKISDSISELAKNILFSKGTWPQLLQQLSHMLNEESLEDIISSLRIISACPDLFEREQAAGIFQLLLKKLNPVYPPELLAAAIESIIAIYAHSPKKYVKTLMGEALAHIWTVLQKIDMNEHEKECKDIVSSLIGLADYAPKLFKPLLTNIIARTIQVVMDDNVEDDLKHTFIEVVITLCEKMPESLRKDPQIPSFIGALFKLLADLEDDEDWSSQSENVEFI